MSRLTEREIARRLAEREDFEPPADLLERIKNEIPPAVTVGPQAPETEKETGMPLRQRWLIAASILAMIGAGLVAFQASLLPRGEEAVSEAPRESAEMASTEAAPEAAAPRVNLEARPAPAPQAQEPRAEPARPQETRGDAPSVLAPPPPPPPPASPKLEIAADGAVEGGVEGEMAGGVVGGVVGGVPGSAPAPPASIPETDAPRRMTLDQRRSSTALVITREELERLPVAPAPSAVPQSAPGNLAGRLSPGGEAAPYPDTFYKSAGVNPFVDTAVDRLSTFGLDVDTGSYTVARRYLADGNLPDPRSVRVEEYVNFFDYGDAPPRQGDFAIRAEGAPSPFTEGANDRLLRFNIRGREVRADNRRPVVLTFVVDVSGSMDQENRLGLVKKSLSLLLDQLKPADRVGLVTYGDDARVLLEPTGDKEAVRRAIESLRPEGSTNAEAGLLAGYDMAGRHFRLNAANRIILCSDGVANVGRTGPLSILGRIGREARRGIELTTLGFGMGNYNDHLMEQLSNKGDGRYAYIDTLDEAKRVLVEEVTGTLQTIAKNAKVQVEFNPAVVARYRLLGYENRDIADARFRDETVDAGEVGAGHSVTALYEVELKPGAPAEGLIATLHLRYKTPEIGNVTETVKKLRVADLAPSWEQAPPGFRLAALVAELAEILKGSPWARGSSLDEVLRRAQAVSKELAGATTTAQVTEFVDLVGRAARAKRQGAVEE
jgi:Ca-activated chloride channel family protein